MDFKKYKSFSIHQFMEDEKFRSWITDPNPQKDLYWKAFLVEYPLQRENMEIAKTLLSHMLNVFESSVKTDEKEELAFRQTLRHAMQEKKVRMVGIRQRRRWIQGFAAAATILLLIVSLSRGYFNQPPPVTEIYTTGYAEWKTISLPDNSMVKLSANSVLKVLGDWSKTTKRQVAIEGEAFFKVEKKLETGSKFQVKTGELVIEVLGTSFNVDTRRDQTRVFLEEGKIKLDLGRMEANLMPGEYIAYSNKEKTILDRQKEAANSHAKWEDDYLLVIDELEVILEKIEDLFGVEIKIADRKDLPEGEIRFAIPKQNLEEVILQLNKLVEIEITIENNVLKVG